jgi:hypothetical protein
LTGAPLLPPPPYAWLMTTCAWAVPNAHDSRTSAMRRAKDFINDFPRRMDAQPWMRMDAGIVPDPRDSGITLAAMRYPFMLRRVSQSAPSP